MNDTTIQTAGTNASTLAIEAEHDKLTRRKFLGLGSAAAALFGAVPAIRAAGLDGAGRNTSDPGPKNAGLDAQNADSVAPPSTDAGSVPTFKYPFSMANKRLYAGGWSREVTMRELPVKSHRRREHAAYRRRCAGTALAYGRRMGIDALRQCQDHGR